VEMKIDPQTVRQLREERAWSQEHLATVAGLSLRTVQRIEREGNASADSRLALGAAFGVDVALLSGKVEMPVPAAAQDPPGLHREWGIKQYAAAYLLLGVVFVYGDVHQNHAVTWAQWPMMGMGCGLALHALNLWRHRRKEAGIAPEHGWRERLRHRAFWEHLVAYAVMSALFVVADLYESGHLTWAFYPIAGWGTGLLLHGRNAFAPHPAT